MNTALFEDVDVDLDVVMDVDMDVSMDDQPHIKLQQWYVTSSISLTIIIPKNTSMAF